MKKVIFSIFIISISNNLFAQINNNIAVLPFNNVGFSVSGSVSLQLDADDLELIESLLIEYARENNNKNEYPYIQIILIGGKEQLMVILEIIFQFN